MIPGTNHYLIHHKLLFKSLTVTLLVEKLREFYKIPDNGLEIKNQSFENVYKAKANWVLRNYPREAQSYFEKFVSYKRFSRGQALHMASDKVRGEVLEPIYKVADRLGIDRHTFEEFVLFGIVPSSPKDESLRIVFDKDFPIFEPGIYLKIGPFTKGIDLARDYKNYKPFVDDFYNAVYKIKPRRKSTGANFNQELTLYEQIESKITEYYQLKTQAQLSRDKIKRRIGEKDYQKIVEDAFRDLAAEEVPDIQDDKEWQRQVNSKAKLFENEYYATARRYNIPTLRDLKTFLRFIPNN